MRLPRVATALVALTVGAAAVVVARRLGARRAAIAAPVPAPAVIPDPAPAEVAAVVLPFARKPSAPPQATAPVRCGDTGGRTKAGAPCAARATAGGRCHHHRLAA